MHRGQPPVPPKEEQTSLVLVISEPEDTERWDV